MHPITQASCTLTVFQNLASHYVDFFSNIEKKTTHITSCCFAVHSLLHAAAIVYLLQYLLDVINVYKPRAMWSKFWILINVWNNCIVFFNKFSSDISHAKQNGLISTADNKLPTLTILAAQTLLFHRFSREIQGFFMQICIYSTYNFSFFRHHAVFHREL